MSRRAWPRRAAWGTLIVLVAVAVTAASLVVWSVRRPFPTHDGTATLAGLGAPVEVLRDAHGVAHLYAEDPLDLYRAQGYVHAQDRFWQMDTWRHITAGRTAELFGPDQLAGDRFLRTLGWARVAEEEYRLLPPADRAVYDAYAEGVNAYLAERSPRRLSLAYTVLGLQTPGYEPEPWEPAHSIAFLKLMAWDLGGNMDAEIERAVLAQTLDDDEIADLFPPYPDDGPVMVRDNAADLDASGHRPPRAADALGHARDPDAARAIARVAERLDHAEALLGPRVDGAGSNSWVLAGERTASGAPILANDPHLGIGMPSVWYEVGLHCHTVNERCPDDVAGFSFAGVPGVVIGHNDRIAWGFTNLGPDVQDLYLERIHPDDPYRYEVEGEWVRMQVVTETLRAADGTAEQLEARITRNGPIISDLYGRLDDLEPGGYEVSLRWTALDPGTTAQAITALNRARDWESFREAAHLLEVPSQNLVYADADGTIAYQAPGRIPIRAEGHDGLLPAPGWDDDYQWQGFIDFEALPRELDPARGWIVTANNAVVGDDYPHPLNPQWDHGYRARRIEELVDGAAGVDVAAAAADQLDEFDGSAAFLVPRLLAVDPAGDDRVAEMQDLLDDWDYQQRVDSAPAAAYAATWRALLDRLFAHLPERYRPTGNARWFEAVRLLLDDPDSAWWRADQDATLAGALADAHEELTDRLGDPDDWAWGRLHTATFVEGTLGQSGVGLIENRFNRGPYEVGGGSGIINATSWDAREGYEVVAVPSMRMVVDLGDLDRTRTIHAPGQSGHPHHRDYADLATLWAQGEQRDAVFTREAVEDAAERRLELRP